MDNRVVERLTEGLRLRIASVKRGKTTERETKVIGRVEFNGEFVEIEQKVKAFFVEFPGELVKMFTSQSAALAHLADLRSKEPEGLTHNERIRLYSVAQGMARRVRSSESAISESERIIPSEIRDRWNLALSEISDVCKEIASLVSWEDLQEAEIKQMKIDEENAKVS
jgi:hypothetical protein